MSEAFEIKHDEVEALAKALSEAAPSPSPVKLSRDGNVLVARYKLRSENDAYRDGNPHQVVIVGGKVVA